MHTPRVCVCDEHSCGSGIAAIATRSDHRSDFSCLTDPSLSAPSVHICRTPIARDHLFSAHEQTRLCRPLPSAEATLLAWDVWGNPETAGWRLSPPSIVDLAGRCGRVTAGVVGTCQTAPDMTPRYGLFIKSAAYRGSWPGLCCAMGGVRHTIINVDGILNRLA